jgi:hypothetical protein
MTQGSEQGTREAFDGADEHADELENLPTF